MPIEKWSDQVSVIRLADDPQFTEDLNALEKQVGLARSAAVLDFSGVGFISSSNIARLLQLRRKVTRMDSRLMLCSLSTNLWGTILVTGLDQLFDFSDNVATALATLQMV